MLKRLAQIFSPPVASAAMQPLPGASQCIEMGNAAIADGDLAAARRWYRQALDADPAHRLARVNLGYVLLEQGDAAGALDLLQQALRMHGPQDGYRHDAAFLAGQAHERLGDRDQAIACYAQALAAKPDFEEALRAAVATLLAAGRSEEALAWADRACATVHSATPAMLRARALHACGRTHDAVTALRELLQRYPDHAGALESLGNLLLEQDQGDEAVAAFRRLQQVAGATPDNVANLAAALVQLGRAQEACDVAAGALALHPRHADLRYTHGLARLLLGDLPAGWEGYEARWGSAAFHHAQPPGPAGVPRWDGTQSLAGRSLLLCAEQGLGDTIQFLRYVPLLAARAREVLVQVQPPLLPLVHALAPNVRVLPDTQPAPAADLQCALLSVPHALRTTLHDVPPPALVGVDATRAREWAQRLPAGTKPRVGLVWSGNAVHRNDRHRSIPLQLFAPLRGVPAEFIGLQPEVRAPDRDALAGWPPSLRLGESFRDFADTAAVIACLDLVIAVDTSVAHLAGALGRPLWILLPFNPDWRWQLARTDSPWYPGARLYRQETAGAWPAVLERVAADLRAFVQERGGEAC